MTAVLLAESGFITSRSSAWADLSLIIEVVAVLLLTIGVVAAVRHNYGRHRAFQTVGVILSVIPAVLWMVPSLLKNTLPDLPGNLDDSSQVLTIIHSVVATVAVILGLVLVVRGNQLMARGASLSSYKGAMRIAYVLYVVAAVLGVILYVSIYG